MGFSRRETANSDHPDQVGQETDAQQPVTPSHGEQNAPAEHEGEKQIHNNGAKEFPWELTKAAIDAGYDSVLFDGGRLPYEVNILETRRVVDYAGLTRGPFMVEGELGYLRGSSQVQREVTISPADYTKPSQAADFVARTGVARLAVAFGNIHGIVTAQREELDIGRLMEIAAVVPAVQLVLHGASGLPDAQIKAAIAAGITNVHFNTELRVAYTTHLREALTADPSQTTPFKLMAPAADAVRDIVEKKTRVFMG